MNMHETVSMSGSAEMLIAAIIMLVASVLHVAGLYWLYYKKRGCSCD